MTQEIKCTQCHGTKVTDIGNGRYRCLYCGTTFQIEMPQAPQTAPQQPQQPQVIIVQQQQAQPDKIEIEQKPKTKRTSYLLLFGIGLFGLGISNFIEVAQMPPYRSTEVETTMGAICVTVGVILSIVAVVLIKNKKKDGREV